MTYGPFNYDIFDIFFIIDESLSGYAQIKFKIWIFVVCYMVFNSDLTKIRKNVSGAYLRPLKIDKIVIFSLFRGPPTWPADNFNFRFLLKLKILIYIIGN